MDNNLTMKIGAFLKVEHPTDKQIIDAAEMLLQLDPGRERGVYNSACQRPQSLLPWVRADLQKFYKIRIAGITNAEVGKYIEETEKVVLEDLQQKPEGIEVATTDNPAVTSERGKRADHDQLPDEIQALYVENLGIVIKSDETHAVFLPFSILAAKPERSNQRRYVLIQTSPSVI